MPFVLAKQPTLKKEKNKTSLLTHKPANIKIKIISKAQSSLQKKAVLSWLMKALEK